MRRLSVVLVVLSLILSSFVFMPGSVSAEDTPQFVVQKWADVPEGAFLLRFERNIKGVSWDGAPAYVAVNSGSGVKVYKYSSPTENPSVVLTYNGSYKFFDFDPAHNGYIFTIVGTYDVHYGDVIYIYKGGEKLNTYDGKRMYGIAHWKNYLIYGSVQGVNNAYWSGGKWIHNVIKALDALTHFIWTDYGEIYYGFGQVAWFDPENLGPFNIGAFTRLGENKVEGVYRYADEMYLAIFDTTTAKRYIVKVEGDNYIEIMDISGSGGVDGLYKIGNHFIIYRDRTLYELSDGSLKQIVGNVVSPIMHNGMLFFIGKDGIYTLSEQKPLNVSILIDKDKFDINSNEMKATLTITNNEKEAVSVSCSASEQFVKFDKSSLTVAPGKENVVVTIDKNTILKDYPRTDKIISHIVCTMKAGEGKEKIWKHDITVLLPQIGFDKTKDKFVGNPTEQDTILLGSLYNNGATYGKVKCSFDKDWGEVILSGDTVYHGKTESVSLKLHADKMVKENHGTLTCQWLGGTISQSITYIRTDVVDVVVTFDRGAAAQNGIDFKDFKNWKGTLGIENHDSVPVEVYCRSTVDWMLPDVITATIKPGQHIKETVMPETSAIEAHWPSSPSVYGSYHCTIKWNGGSMEQITASIRVKLPQMQFKSKVYDITVSDSSKVYDVIEINNTGDGLAEVTCQTDKDWAHIKMSVDGGSLHDTALAVIRKMAGIALRFDYDSMPDNDLVNITCRWAGGEYKADFNVVKQTGPEYSLNIITTHVPLADVIDDFATIASIHVSGGSIPLHVSADKGFIIVKADSEVSDGSADISIEIDRKKITFADMTPPYIKVNITVQYGDKQEVIPVKIEIKRALKLFVPLNKLEQTYELWTPEKEWQKLVSSDSAPFINPLYNRTYVPLRLVSEGLGLKVGWDGKERLITIESDKYKIVLDVKKVVKKKIKIAGRYEYIYESTNRYAKIYEKSAGSTSYGRSVYVYPTAIRQGRSYVPVRFIAEQVKSLVFWDGKTRTVYIYR